MLEMLLEFWQETGLMALSWKEVVTIGIASLFLYLAIKKGYEPYLLLPIAFGMLLVNLPLGGLMAPPTADSAGGLLYYLYQGVELGIYPPLIFLCLGATIDFGPLIANPVTLLLGGGAQIGIFVAFFGAIALGMTGPEASSIGIIGGADGPTAIYVASQLAPRLLSSIALAAYSYMALVPIIQPPIIRLLTTPEQRKIKMEQLRPVSKKEKIVFPIVVTLFTTLLVPSSAPLIGMLMLGNLVKESGRVPKIAATLENAFMYIITILLGISVGAKAEADVLLSVETGLIILSGLTAFAAGTAGGILMGQVMYVLSKGKINPMIGSAGVSAVPMAARVVQKEGAKANPTNFLLMHAMGPNVAGVIGSAVAAGVLLQFFS